VTEPAAPLWIAELPNGDRLAELIIDVRLAPGAEKEHPGNAEAQRQYVRSLHRRNLEWAKLADPKALLATRSRLLYPKLQLYLEEKHGVDLHGDGKKGPSWFDSLDYWYHDYQRFAAKTARGAHWANGEPVRDLLSTAVPGISDELDKFADAIDQLFRDPVTEEVNLGRLSWELVRRAVITVDARELLRGLSEAARAAHRTHAEGRGTPPDIYRAVFGLVGIWEASYPNEQAHGTWKTIEADTKKRKLHPDPNSPAAHFVADAMALIDPTVERAKIRVAMKYVERDRFPTRAIVKKRYNANRPE
jgi:hypothetical protein